MKKRLVQIETTTASNSVLYPIIFKCYLGVNIWNNIITNNIITNKVIIVTDFL